MEILVAVAAKAAEYTVGPIMRGARAVFNPQNIIQKTREEQQRLQELHNQVNDRCHQAKSDGNEITDDANKWLETTQAALTEVAQWLQESVNETDTSTCCTRSSTSKWVWAHKQRKNAKRNKGKLCDMIKEGEKLSNISRLAPAMGMTLLSGTGFIKFNSVKVAFDKLMEFLREGQGMIGIYGMGGVGKTSLVKEAYKEAEVEKLFSKVVVAVVSQTPNIHKIQAELGEQLCLRYSTETHIGRAAQLRNRMKLEDKILVVLDDVWSDIDLASIGIPFRDDHKGCKVVLTTRSKLVCSKMDCNDLINLIPLNPSESWGLFKTHAGDRLRGPCEFEDLAKEVAEECGELPLALIVVASALKDKDKEEWELALMKLKQARITEIEDIGDTVYVSIKLSYDFLTAEVTKRCFLMCCLFPEDYEISVEALTRYALGYGLFDEDTDSYDSANKQVIVTIRHLVACNLLISTDSMSGRSKMHDVVRDAALWITSKGKEVFLVPIPSQNNWTRDPKLNNATAISLLSCPMNQHLPSLTECPRLQMLLMAQRIPLPNVQDDCFGRLTALQVLDMTAISRQLPHLVLPSSLQHLCKLRTLLLRRWKLIGDLSIIGSLTSLQILSFAGSAIGNLPGELLDLKELMLLDLSGCRVEGIDYEVMGKLSSKLEKLLTVQQPISDFFYDMD